jgi:hypothetical protein
MNTVLNRHVVGVVAACNEALSVEERRHLVVLFLLHLQFWDE